MHTQKPQSLLEQLQWRYAVKQFDATKKVTPEQWDVLEQALVLSPSSFGLQPWKFLVITDQKVKQDIKPMSWNQSQVTDCSHYVVFCTLTNVTEKHVDDYVQDMAKTRGVTAESLAGYRNMMVNDFVKGPRSSWVAEWTARQAYIALGTLMTAAASIGIDTCPFEGFVPEKYDSYFQLEKEGYRSVCACAVGFRAETDKYATAKKVRFDNSHLIKKY